MKVSNSEAGASNSSDHGDELKCKSFEAMIQASPEPETYNFRLLNQLNEVLRKHDGDPFRNPYKLDTGMRRPDDLKNQKSMELIVRLRKQ